MRSDYDYNHGNHDYSVPPPPATPAANTHGRSKTNTKADTTTTTTTTTKRFGLWELCIFVMAIISGTACSVLSKLMMGLHGTGLSGETEVFRKPIFQTFSTFLGMSFGLVLHLLV